MTLQQLIDRLIALRDETICELNANTIVYVCNDDVYERRHAIKFVDVCDEHLMICFNKKIVKS